MYCKARAPAGWRDAGLYVRESLRAGATIDGPAIDRRAQRHHRGRARLAGAQLHATSGMPSTPLAARSSCPRAPRATQHAIGTEADPVMLEVFNNLFMNIAEQMGLRLQNTAYSVNIKERLDFSCALFDADGNLIANAPHMPVHLGSMSESIKTVIAAQPGTMQPGDVYVLNDPYHGGTHLPDVTVVTPVYLEAPTLPRSLPPRARSDRGPGSETDAVDAKPSFYVASRGHHADIGGSTPGSMPPFSTTIDEEGVLFDNFLLVRDGRAARSRAARATGQRPVSGAQPRPDHRRPARADRRQREGRAGTARDGGAVRPRHGGRLHAPRAGQRRGIGAPRHRRA